ncbi:MAG TPA: tripartite tricarboxylate transporter substrate-binding protein [Micropepsaceae bacterium]|nr:tripartite tricarboxylate transporter substrate-binding protein [Micropepsaceae bacterium]
MVRDLSQHATRRELIAGLAGGAFNLGVRGAVAAPADFYRGKSVNMVVGFAPGGGVDTTSRVVARHLARFIPGAPRLIVQNMEGAAGIVASNYLYQRVAADGLTIGVPGRSWFVEGAMQTMGVRFDATKFSYIGSPGAVNSVVYVRRSTGVKNFQDLQNAKKPLTFGALGNLTPTAMVPFLLAANGLPVKVVVGYVSSARVIVALEQGEVDGFFTVETSFGLREELVARKIIQPILQNKPVHPGIPLIRDVLPKSDGPLLNVVMALESFGLPVIGPPGIPADRLEILRNAFLAMCRDHAFQADAVKADLPVGNPLSGAQLTTMMKNLVAASTPAIIARYKRLGTPV